MSKKTPPTPDYAGLAAQQGAANEATARTSNLINNPNQITPTGSTSWSAPDANGRFTRTETLSPDEQRKLDLGNQAGIYSMSRLNESLPSLLKGLGGFDISGKAAGDWDPRLNPQTGYQIDTGIEQAPDLQTGLNFSSAPGMPQTGMGARDQATGAMYREQTKMLDPQFQQQESDMQAKLANQGIQPGSAAYQREMDNFNRNKQQAYSSARDQAIGQGGAEYDRQFGTGLQARQQGVNELTTQGQFGNQARGQGIGELLAAMGATNNAIGQQYSTAAQGTQLNNAGRAQNLNEQAQQMQIPVNILTALLSGTQVQSPNFQPFSQNTNIESAPIFQAGLAQNQFNQDAANRAQSLFGQVLGAGAGLGGAALRTYSDVRLKSDVKRVGALKSGLPVYEYNIFGKRERGVMAHEAERLFPHAVSADDKGFLMVDYAEIN